MPIMEMLEGLGLRSFVGPLAVLLEQVSGIEVAFDLPDEDTGTLLRQQLSACQHLSQDDARVLLMQACIGLPAFRYRAGAATGPEVWHPLRESLAQFRARHTELVFWLDGELHPPVRETLDWLRSWGC